MTATFNSTVKISPKTVALVRNTLATATEPVTLAELTMYLRATQRKISHYTVRAALEHMANAGEVMARFESSDERESRAVARGTITGPAGRPAMLFWHRANGPTMPNRTSASILPGTDISTRVPEVKKRNEARKQVNQRNKLKKLAHDGGRLAKAQATVQTGTRFDRIEARVKHVETLEARIAKLEATIASLVKTLS